MNAIEGVSGYNAVRRKGTKMLWVSGEFAFELAIALQKAGVFGKPDDPENKRIHDEFEAKLIITEI